MEWLVQFELVQWVGINKIPLNDECWAPSFQMPQKPVRGIVSLVRHSIRLRSLVSPRYTWEASEPHFSITGSGLTFRERRVLELKRPKAHELDYRSLVPKNLQAPYFALLFRSSSVWQWQEGSGETKWKIYWCLVYEKWKTRTGIEPRASVYRKGALPLSCHEYSWMQVMKLNVRRCALSFAGKITISSG